MEDTRPATIVKIRGGENNTATLEAHLVTKGDAIRVSFKMRRHGSVKPFVGAPYLNCEEWDRLYDKVYELLA